MSTRSPSFAPILHALSGCSDSIFYEEVDEVTAKGELEACRQIICSNTSASVPMLDRYRIQMLDLAFQCRSESNTLIKRLDHLRNEQCRIENRSYNAADIVTLAECIALIPYFEEEAERLYENSLRYFNRADFADQIINSL